MNVRELLHIEIWSKGTSRRILVCLCIVVACFVAWHYADARWLTHGEREAGRTALLQIDSLQLKSSEEDDRDFDDRKQLAQQSVEAAEHAAWTTRDKNLALTLSGYLNLIAIDRAQMKSDKLLEQRHIVLTKQDPAFEMKLSYEGLEVRRILSLELHSSFDN